MAVPEDEQVRAKGVFEKFMRLLGSGPWTVPLSLDEVHDIKWLLSHGRRHIEEGPVLREIRHIVKAGSGGRPERLRQIEQVLDLNHCGNSTYGPRLSLLYNYVVMRTWPNWTFDEDAAEFVASGGRV